MYEIVNDRIFWVYFIITFFFIIIGLNSLTIIYMPLYIIISILWVISTFCLLILIYFAAIKWDKYNILEENAFRMEETEEKGCTPWWIPVKGWAIFVNLLFITILILSMLWITEIKNNTTLDDNYLQSTYGILVLLGGLLLTNISFGKNFQTHPDTISPFCLSIIFLTIWVGLVSYYSLRITN